MKNLKFQNWPQTPLPFNATQAQATHPVQAKWQTPPRHLPARGKRNLIWSWGGGRWGGVGGRGRGGGGGRRERRGTGGTRPLERDSIRQLAAAPGASPIRQAFGSAPVESWANGRPRYRLLGTGILDPNGYVAGQSGSRIAAGRGTSAPGSTSDWSPPAADPGLLGGAGGRQQRWVSSERGHWWRRRWTAWDLLWSQSVRCCLLGCGPQVACITIGRKTHFICVLLGPPGPTESEIQGWALGDC